MWDRHDRIVLDACCVLTLYASRRMREILASVEPQIVVCRYILEEEALYTFTGPDEDVRSVKAPIDLNPLIDEGLLEITSLSGEAETLSFVNLASRLDDGEAQTIALAVNRNWGVATDERKASNIVREIAPSLQIITTPDFLKHWADTAKIPESEIRAVLRSIHSRAIYRPGRRHPLYDWWEASYGTD